MPELTSPLREAEILIYLLIAKSGCGSFWAGPFFVLVEAFCVGKWVQEVSAGEFSTNCHDG